MVALTDISSHSQIDAEDFVLHQGFQDNDDKTQYKKKQSANGSACKLKNDVVNEMKTSLSGNRLGSHSCSKLSLNNTVVQKKEQKSEVEECPLIIAFFTFLSFGVLLFVGYIKEFFYPPSIDEKNREGYVPLYIGFESFYTRNVYRRIQLCWGSPISSVPGAKIELLERYTPDYGWTMKLSGRKMVCHNVGSYNYLGFAENTGACHDAAFETTRRLGITTSSSRLELGSMRIQRDLETLMAEFLKVEDS
ncbi:UNVERIFIED_CONTAM: hypothetical protein GTU68_002617, partial [Idotea baltica]|nr:hypothetical protein [Idotea baltica]